MHRVNTNQIKVSFSFSKINRSFSFIKIKSSEEKYWNALYLDSLINIPVLKSIVYENEASFYAMLNVTGDETIDIVESIVKEYDSLGIDIVSAESIEQHSLTQLLINSLASNESEFFRFNNLSGKFYYSHPSWFKKKGRVIWQIPTLEFKVTKDFILQDSVATFTSISNRKWMNLTEKRFKELPKYYFNNTNYTLKRKLPNENKEEEDIFIMRQVKGAKKTIIPLIDFSSWEKFIKSKSGAWYYLLSRIEKDLKNYINIEFDSWENAQWSEFRKTNFEFKEKRISELLKEKRLILIDAVSNNNSIVFCERFSLFLNEQLQIKLKINSKPKKNDLCIKLINNKENQEEVDQYKEAGQLFSKGIATHHITVEDFLNQFKFYLEKEINIHDEKTQTSLRKQNKTALTVIKNILKEIVIKDDILSNQISIIDWKSNDYKDDWMFAWKDKAKDSETIGFLKVSPNGILEFEILDLCDLFSASKYESYKKFFDPPYKHNNFHPEGLIQSANGFINIIGLTKRKAIPAFKKIDLGIL